MCVRNCGEWYRCKNSVFFLSNTASPSPDTDCLSPSSCYYRCLYYYYIYIHPFEHTGTCIYSQYSCSSRRRVSHSLAARPPMSFLIPLLCFFSVSYRSTRLRPCTDRGGRLQRGSTSAFLRLHLIGPIGVYACVHAVMSCPSCHVPLRPLPLRHACVFDRCWNVIADMISQLSRP